MTKNNITSIAIGGFDGMHLGHQTLFGKLDCQSGAVVVIETKYANLTPKKYREQYTKHQVYYYQLNNIKHLDGKQFVDLLIKDFPKLEKIIVGYDFHFGKNRKYSIDDLKIFFNKQVIIVNEVSIEDISIHSRIIRKFISNGQIKKANLLLGKEYKIQGTHIKGQGLGNTQFVPTINLQCDGFLLPQNGIYATKTIINNCEYPSVTFVGHRLSTDGTFAIETHIINQTLELQFSKVEIKFIEKIRDNQKFNSFDKLREQIFEDIKTTKNRLGI